MNLCALGIVSVPRFLKTQSRVQFTGSAPTWVISSVEERRTLNSCVVGSNPTSPTKGLYEGI